MKEHHLILDGLVDHAYADVDDTMKVCQLHAAIKTEFEIEALHRKLA